VRAPLSGSYIALRPLPLHEAKSSNTHRLQSGLLTGQQPSPLRE
jgi:hypothetical protein